MRFVADESVDGPIVYRLRADGHEVEYVAELSPGIKDPEVLSIARDRSVVLITADKDFGELIFRNSLAHAGLVLLRIWDLDETQSVDLVSAFIRDHAASLPGAVSVVTSTGARIRPRTS